MVSDIIPIYLPEDFEKFKENIIIKQKKKAEELGGLVSGEHGIGYAKKEYLKAQYGETPIAIMQGIKRVLDEKNILNPGKICFLFVTLSPDSVGSSPKGRVKIISHGYITNEIQRRNTRY